MVFMLDLADISVFLYVYLCGVHVKMERSVFQWFTQSLMHMLL